MEGDDVALASQLVARDNDTNESFKYKCCIGKFSSAITILPDFALHDCDTIFRLSLPRNSPHVNQINKLSYNLTQVNKPNIKLLKATIQLTLNNKP